MRLHVPTQSVFDQIEAVLLELSDSEYGSSISLLSAGSIGKHVRHVIEMYQCLIEGYDKGHVDYAQRKRDTLIEQSREKAIATLRAIQAAIDLPDKPLTIAADYHDEQGAAIRIDSNFQRELAFNLEHAIHHMALMRIGVSQVSDLVLPESFGVAFATVNFRNQCAQ